MLEKLRAGMKHAFAVEPPGYQFSEEETRIVDKLSDFLVKRRLTTPAIFFIKSSAPLNMVVNQFLVFLNPFATYVLNKDEYETFTGILEHRNSMDFMVTRLEEAQRRLDAGRSDAGTNNVEKEVEEGN